MGSSHGGCSGCSGGATCSCSGRSGSSSCSCSGCSGSCSSACSRECSHSCTNTCNNKCDNACTKSSASTEIASLTSILLSGGIMYASKISDLRNYLAKELERRSIRNKQLTTITSGSIINSNINYEFFSYIADLRNKTYNVCQKNNRATVSDYTEAIQDLQYLMNRKVQ